MHSHSRKILVASVLALLTVTSASWGQFVPGSPATQRAYGAGVRRGAYAGVPGGGYYGPGYYTNTTRAQGYLNGISNVIGAQGQYGKDYEQTRMMNQQVYQEKYKTRKAYIQEKQYEQSLIPTENEAREKQQQEALRRTMNHPPITEIINGSALNVLLTEQEKLYAQRIIGPDVELSPYVLAKINVTAPTGGGNIGIFADGGVLQWPFALRARVYEKDRAAVDKLAKQAFDEARKNAITPETVNDLNQAQKNLLGTLNVQVHHMPLGDYMTCKKFLDQLGAGITSLKAPGTANYFNGKWAARGHNVAELVANMAREGLIFAAATRGNEPEYSSLHQSMVSYQYGVQSVLHAQGTAPRQPPK